MIMLVYRDCRPGNSILEVRQTFPDINMKEIQKLPPLDPGSYMMRVAIGNRQVAEAADFPTR